MDVLLHGVAPIDAGADLAEHLVPRAPDLCVQVATQRSQVLVARQDSLPKAYVSREAKIGPIGFG